MQHASDSDPAQWLLDEGLVAMPDQHDTYEESEARPCIKTPYIKALPSDILERYNAFTRHA